MSAEITIEGRRFFINGQPTYAGVSYRGFPVEGLLMNSRMIQAIFDDANPQTRPNWRYPDTGAWDAERNTDEFIAQLPAYREHGLLAFTVGMQGGGSIYQKDVYGHYLNTAYDSDGGLKPAYLDRLLRVIKAADALGMVVIVNYFYGIPHLTPDDATIRAITERLTAWLLATGYRNLMVDVVNEAWDYKPSSLMQPNGCHELIDIVQQTTLDGRRLLVGISPPGGRTRLPVGEWAAKEDFHLPHGNGCTPEDWRDKLRELRSHSPDKPLLCNEDSPVLSKLDIALEEYASWGYYDQGYGSGYRQEPDFDWTLRGRELHYDELSGFQTVPVNWGINTPEKRAFFERLKRITSGD